MSWVRYLVGRVLPVRVLTVDDLRDGAQLKWGWRATRIEGASGVVAYVPPPSRPGYIGAFRTDPPAEEE